MGTLRSMARRVADIGYVSREDYLAAERVAPTKSEWVDGVVYAMAGSSKRHVAAVSRMMEFLAGAARQKGCLIGASDLLVETANANYYPDVVVSCRPSDDPYVEHHPCFIGEVLSPSTNRVDRAEKRDAYLAIESMETYWIVDAEHHIVEAWERSDDRGHGRQRPASDPLPAARLGVTVRVIDIVGT